MNKLREGEEVLEHAIRDFSHLWAEAGDLWNDDAKRHFESEFVSAVHLEAPALLRRVHELAETIEQARREID